MELKDVILSTLAEMEEEGGSNSVHNSSEVPDIEEKNEIHNEDESEKHIDDELAYLNSIRERLLVLFEGFQSPNNANLEAKIDMTLNFLEYTLATIDSRIQTLEKGNSK
ncbi:MAG: hypothetical protein JXQ67_04460 [Campylobacterales bacterium]|nr:hypothetical protein [Campylobacterales bacterium]